MTDHNSVLLRDLSHEQRCHLAWRLESKTFCGYLNACRIARLETDHKHRPVYEVFLWAGMTERAAKIHSTKVINFRV